MARTKQAAPIRREPSSEYVSKLDREAAIAAKKQEDAVAAAVKAPAKATAGVQQAMIAVLGIYGSL